MAKSPRPQAGCRPHLDGVYICAGASVKHGVARAQVSHGAPTHHFRNKAGLLTAYAAQGFDRLTEVVEAAIATESIGDGRALLSLLGRGYVRFALAHPQHFELMFRIEALDPHDPELAAASDRAFLRLQTTVERCAREGFIDPKQTTTVAVAAWSLVHGLAGLSKSGRLQHRLGTSDTERVTQEVIASFVAGLLPSPAAPGAAPPGSPAADARRRRQPTRA